MCAGMCCNHISAQVIRSIDNKGTIQEIDLDTLAIDGDVTGELNNTTVEQIQNVAVSNAAPEDQQVLVYNETTMQWEPTPPTAAALVLTKSTIRSIDRARVLLDGNNNINANTITNITPSNIPLNEIGASIGGSSITGLEGNVRFVVQLNFDSNSQRSNFYLRFVVNGILQNRVYGSVYARNVSNHDDTGGQYIFEYENASPEDSFSFQLERESTTGSVALISSGPDLSFVFVEQFTEIEVITQAVAPTDFSIVQGPAGPIGPAGPAGPTGPPGDITNVEPTDVYHASGNVRADGIPNSIEGATVLQLSTGRYRVTFNSPHPSGANYPVLFSMEQNAGDDDYTPAYTNVSATSFDVEIGEQDNGGNGGVPVDAGFSFFVPF